MIGDSHAAHLSQSLRESFNLININLLQATTSGDLPLLKKEYKEKRMQEMMNYLFYDFIPKNAKDLDSIILSAHWAKDENAKGVDVLKSLKENIEYLNKYHIKTIVVGQSEIYNIPYPTITAKEYQYHSKESNKYLKNAPYIVDKLLKDNLKSNYVSIINFNTFPPLSSDYIPYIFDNVHFTKYGADLATHKILVDPITQTLIYKEHIKL